MAESRLIGAYPVIGIRPTIDGRRGALDVRGSLEEQTMNMAKSAAKLFEENLRYSNGEPVKVVIADSTIGRVGESAACADKFRREGVDITVTVTPCWCYGSETMDMDPQTIKAVWGFNGTERPGAVYLASVLATHAQKGLPAFGIYGHDVCEADDTSIPEDVQEKLLRFGRAAVAAASTGCAVSSVAGEISTSAAGSAARVSSAADAHPDSANTMPNATIDFFIKTTPFILGVVAYTIGLSAFNHKIYRSSCPCCRLSV